MGYPANSEDSSRDQTASTTDFKINNVLVIENEYSSLKTDVDISSPSTSTTPYDFDFCYENIDNTFNGSNTSDTKITSYNNCKGLESDYVTNRVQSYIIEPSDFNLTNNCSQVKLSTSSQLISIPHSFESYVGCTDVVDSGNSIVDATLPLIYETIPSKVSQEGNNIENEIIDDTKSTVDMMQSVFTDILKDMKDIEDYISAYISSFCILEEEFDNYAAIKSSSEAISNFLNEMQSSGKEILEESTSESKNKQNKVCVSIKDEKSHVLLEQYVENYLHENSNQTIASYCYWEDDIASFQMDGNTSINNVDKVTIQENSHRNNKALVPLKFFENLWKHRLELFCEDVNNDDSLQYKCCDDTSIPQYCPSTLYDPIVLEEAETIVHAVDTFLNGCFYTEQNNRYQSIPCTIIELDDDYNEPFNICGKSNSPIVNNAIKSDHKLSNTQAEWNENTRNVTQLKKPVCPAVNKNEIRVSNSNIDNTNFLNTPKTKIQSGYSITATTSKSDAVLGQPVNDKSKDNSRCNTSVEPTKYKNTYIEEPTQMQNHKITNYETTNKNSEKIKIYNLTTKELQNNKQNPMTIKFSKVSSPNNIQRTRLCSSEYRGNPSDVSVNSLEERIASELSEKNSNSRARSRFVHVQEENNDSSTTNDSSYLFSSTNVQLNLTNPLLNEKK